MSLDLLVSNPAVWAAGALAILLAIGVHEFAHAAVARALGDTTAQAEGRLTLNPIAHVDTFGLLMLLLVGFGWGKPVPFDPAQLRARRWGPALVALAGPLANVVGCALAGFLLGIIERTALLPTNNLLVFFLAFSFQFHLVLFLFNLIPIPPLDGSKLLFGLLAAPRWMFLRNALAMRGPMMLLALIIADAFTGGYLLGRWFHAALRWASGLF